jgi:NitT/TauT family transport system permease protein
MASLVAGVLLWWLATVVFNISSFKLPTPWATLDRAWQLGSEGALTVHIEQTLAEIIQGVLLGAVIGVIMAVIFSRFRWVERLFMPVIVVLQVTPKISIAPLIVLWLGLGIGSKIALVTVVTCYPILINMTARLRGLPTAIDDLSRLLNIGPIRRAVTIELPYCLPALATGLRLGILQAVTAAVIGEFIGAQFGLGFLEKQAQDNDDIRLVLTALMLLCLIAWLLYAAVGVVERKLHARFGG